MMQPEVFYVEKGNFPPFSVMNSRVFNSHNRKPYRMNAQQETMKNESYYSTFSPSALSLRSYCGLEHCLHIRCLLNVKGKVIHSPLSHVLPHSILFYATFHSSRRLIALAMKQVSPCMQRVRLFVILNHYLILLECSTRTFFEREACLKHKMAHCFRLHFGA